MSQEVLEGNKLIAEFMGGRKAVFNITIEEYYKNPPHGRSLMPKDLKYHTSWDWLMPVWNHFRFLCWKTIGYTKEFEEWKAAFLRDVFNVDCDSAAKTMVGAITWYNSITKPINNE